MNMNVNLNLWFAGLFRFKFMFKSGGRNFEFNSLFPRHYTRVIIRKAWRNPRPAKVTEPIFL
jgi:hypothetical protein